MSAAEWLNDSSRGIARVVRPGQVAMAKLVEEVLTSEKGGVAFLEAGTGTGKSFAYSVPAILSGKRVVISTAKKALQNQLVEKDLPFLTGKIKQTSFSLLKGKNNYACGLRFNELRENDAFTRLPIFEQNAFANWMEAGGYHDLSDFTPPFTLESMVRVTECVRKNCPYAESTCGYVKARDAAMAAQIVVVNHALLAYDLSVGGGKILGPYDALIIDEGHQAPKYFREAFSLKLHHKHPEAIKRLFDGTEFEPHALLEHIYNSIFTTVAPKSERLSLTDKLRQSFEDLYTELDKTYRKLKARGLLDEDEGAQEAATAVAVARAKLKSGATLVDKSRKLAQIVLGTHVVRDEEGQIVEGDDTDYLCYVEKRGRGEVPEIVVTPVEVGPLIAPGLLGLGRVVVTSATLATPNGMDYMAREYGLTPGQVAIKQVLASPFDYKARSTAYVSSTSPDPSGRGDDYYSMMSEEIHELLVASKGGAFVLCASYDDMNKLADGCRELLRGSLKGAGAPYLVSTQVGSPEPLLDWFKNTPRAVLFAVKTFWEGVDVPGLGLRLVVIPRLPFPNAGDVVLQARKKLVMDRLIENAGYEEKRASLSAWDSFDFQEAIMDLKQGAGRLIRSETDMGVVALLDRRAFGTTKGYSNKVRAALPMPTTSDKAKVLQFLTALAGKAAVPELPPVRGGSTPKLDRSGEL